MKRYVWAALIWATLMGLQDLQAQQMTVLCEAYAPYSYHQDGRLTGSSVEVVRELLRRVGHPDNIKVLPWARAYHLLQHQPHVALFSTARTAARDPLFHWVGPLCIVRSGFYARQGAAIKIRSLEDARKIGAIATYKDDVKEQTLRLYGFTNLDSSNSPVSNLKKLLSGRVDVSVFDNVGLPAVARQIGADPRQLRLVFPIEEYPLYIAISKGTPMTVVRTWQKALAQMLADGTLKAISRSWLPEESLARAPLPSKRTAPDALRLMIYTEDSPPGNYLEGGQPSGYAVDIVRAILRRLDRPEQIKVVPWARGYQLALARPNVVLFSTTRLPQREQLFKWVGPLYSQCWGFYMRKGAGLNIASLDDARQVGRIGTYHNDAKEQFLQSRGFTNLVSANKNASNVRHLMQGHIDLWVSSDYNMAYIVRKAGEDPDKLELAYPFETVSNYIAFSRQTADAIVQAWQRALNDLIADGTLARLRTRHVKMSYAR